MGGANFLASTSASFTTAGPILLYAQFRPASDAPVCSEAQIEDRGRGRADGRKNEVFVEKRNDPIHRVLLLHGHRRVPHSYTV